MPVILQGDQYIIHTNLIPARTHKSIVIFEISSTMYTQMTAIWIVRFGLHAKLLMISKDQML